MPPPRFWRLIAAVLIAFSITCGMHNGILRGYVDNTLGRSVLTIFDDIGAMATILSMLIYLVTRFTVNNTRNTEASHA